MFMCDFDAQCGLAEQVNSEGIEENLFQGGLSGQVKFLFMCLDRTLKIHGQDTETLTQIITRFS